MIDDRGSALLTLKYHSTDKILERKSLEELAIRSMVESLDDDYSNYLNKEEKTKLKNGLAGNKDIGIRNVSKEMGKNIIIWRVFKDSPAYKSGVVAGDIITKIDGLAIKDVEDEKIAPLMQGVEGSNIDLEIMRPATNETINFSIKREESKVKLLDYTMLNDDIGYISALEISTGLEKEFKSALEDLISKGMKKLILDLRENGGGDSFTAARIESMFLDDEIKEIGKYNNKRIGEGFGFNNVEKKIFDGELIVLVNKKTASACEFMTDTLRVHKRATIIGEKTFGKGSMQSIFDFPKNETALKLTFMNYERFDGSHIDGIGVSPDILVEQDARLNTTGYISEDNERKEIRLANIEFLLNKKYGEEKAKELIENGDLQLNRAVEELSR